MSATWDVVVIGGGPGGSLTASLVRRQDPGRRVLVLERARGPRFHVGESTVPSWRPILERAGVLEAIEASPAMRKLGGFFRWGAEHGQSWTIDFRDPETGGPSCGGFQVDRSAFDELLLRHAAGLGADVREGAHLVAADALPGGGFRVRWTEDGVAHAAEAAYLVDASGQARALSRLWEIPLIPFDGMNNFAVWGYWTGSRVWRETELRDARERWTYITTCDDGWLWHIPIAPDLVSVGVVTDAASLRRGGPLEEFYLRNARGDHGVGALLAGATLGRHPRAEATLSTIRDWSYRAERLCGEGWFLVGDAALFVDPILSSGLLITANGASMAANALHTLWTDRTVDAALLRDSYHESYTDVGMSFHRLARIWYARNFQSHTWHWEAKRQRLRTGRHPAEETSADAFFKLCIGSCADPIEGAFLPPGESAGAADRPDVLIMGAHLYGAEAPAAWARAAEATSEDDARRVLAEGQLERWRALLVRPVRIAGCVAQVREGYFTDRESTGWTRVRYLDLRGAHEGDAYQRVVFAAGDEPLLAALDGTRPLREVLRALLADARGGERKRRLARLHRLVLSLDIHGWLAAPEDAFAAGSWPEPLTHLDEATIDLLGDELAARLGDVRVALAPVALAPPRVYRTTSTTAFWISGQDPAAAPLVDALVERWRTWETTADGASFWSRGAPSLAGGRYGAR